MAAWTPHKPRGGLGDSAVRCDGRWGMDVLWLHLCSQGPHPKHFSPLKPGAPTEVSAGSKGPQLSEKTEAQTLRGAHIDFANPCQFIFPHPRELKAEFSTS